MIGSRSRGPKWIGPREAAQSEAWQSGRMRRAPTPVWPRGHRRFESDRLRRVRRDAGSPTLPASLFRNLEPPWREKGGSCVASSPVIAG